MTAEIQELISMYLQPNSDIRATEMNEICTKIATEIDSKLVGTTFIGSIVPGATPTGTGTAFWIATQDGTYTNFGGVVVAANSFAVISRDALGAFSISQTTFDITSKVNVSDVVNNLTSTSEVNPVSALQAKILNEKFVDYAKKTESVTPVIGKNKFNYKNGLEGFFILNAGGGDIVANAEWGISELIPVTESVVGIKNYVVSGIGNRVYDSNKVFLRVFGSSYTFEAGDAYVQYTYRLIDKLIFQVESGISPTSFEAYTDKGDIVVRLNVLENLQPIEFGLESIYYLPASSTNGLVAREYGFDIPSASTGNGSIHYVRFPNVTGKFKCEFYFLTDMPAANFGAFWHFSVAQESVGVVKMTAEYDNVSGEFQVYPYPTASNTTIAHSFRFSKLVVTPYDLPSYQNLQKLDVFEKKNILEVAKFFTSGTTGWGVSKFSSIIEAHNSLPIVVNYPTDLKRVIRLMPGTYDEFETVWAGADGETGTSYKGIIAKNETTYESFDKKDPSTTILKWDGHAGFSNGYVMSVDNAMVRCMFHLSAYDVNCEINGFTFWAKNVRYCIHPESAGSGYGNHWKIKNCILQWEGRPNVSSPGGTHLGIGISPGEIGEVENVKFTGSVLGGLGGHNNEMSSYLDPFITNFIIQGAKLYLKNVDFNGNNFRMDTISNDATTLDVVTFENVVNINTAEFQLFAPATVQNWRAVKNGVKIVTDNL